MPRHCEYRTTPTIVTPYPMPPADGSADNLTTNAAASIATFARGRPRPMVGNVYDRNAAPRPSRRRLDQRYVLTAGRLCAPHYKTNSRGYANGSIRRCPPGTLPTATGPDRVSRTFYDQSPPAGALDGEGSSHILYDKPVRKY